MRILSPVLVLLTACSTPNTTSSQQLVETCLCPCACGPEASVDDASIDAPAINMATPWVRHNIYRLLNGADGTNLRDVNGDGLLDVTSGWEQSARTSVSLHPGALVKTISSWPTVVINTTISGAEDAVFADVDGDGAFDVISAGDSGEKLYISFGPTNPTDYLTPNAWTTITITAATNLQHWMQVAFTPGRIWAGGRVYPASVGYFAVPSNPRTASAWTYTQIGVTGWIMSLVPRDMDDDGDLDVLLSDRVYSGPTTAKNSSTIGTRWLEAPLWTNHTIYHPDSTVEGEPKFLHSGTNELIDGTSSSTRPNKLTIRAWGTWAATDVPYPLDVGQYQDVASGDINGDGIRDLVLSHSHAFDNSSGVVWLKGDSLGGWQRGEVSGLEGDKFDNVELYDVDGDLDLDIVTSEQGIAGTTPNEDKLGVVWYENPWVP